MDTDPVIRVYPRPSRAPNAAEVLELPAKSAKNAKKKYWANAF